METKIKNNTRVVKLYRYFYPTIIPKPRSREDESPELIEKCLIVEDIRIKNKMPIFSLFTQSALTKEFSTRDC